MDFKQAEDVLFRDVEDLMSDLGLDDQAANPLKDNIVAACAYAHALRSVESCLEYTHCPDSATTAMGFIDYAKQYEPSDPGKFTMAYSGSAPDIAGVIVDTEYNQGPVHFVTNPAHVDFFQPRLDECVDHLSEQATDLDDNSGMQTLVSALETVRDYYNAVRHQIGANLRVQMAHDVPAPA